MKWSKLEPLNNTGIEWADLAVDLVKQHEQRWETLKSELWHRCGSNDADTCPCGEARAYRLMCEMDGTEPKK